MVVRRRAAALGAGAIVVTAGGKDVVLAGQKSGHAWALDAGTGKVLWSHRMGEGTALGGVHWVIATDGAHGEVPDDLAEVACRTRVASFREDSRELRIEVAVYLLTVADVVRLIVQPK